MVRAAREARGESLEEAADGLHMLVRQMQALEAEDWRALPAPAFCRGYYRAYAKWLGLDPETVVAAYNQALGPAAPAAEDEVPARAAVSASTNRPLVIAGVQISTWHLMVAGAALTLLLLWWLLPGQDDMEAGVVQTAPTVQEAAGSALSETPAAPANTDTAEPATEAESAAATTAAPVIAPAAAPVPTPAPASAGMAASAGNAASAEIRRITPAGDDRLHFRFTDDCWVEVRDARGEALFSDLGRAGQQWQLAGAGPFQVLLGNAPAVSLSFNEQPVSIQSRRPGNVATLRLGY